MPAVEGPKTLNLLAGEESPMPTFPELSMRRRSFADPSKMRKGLVELEPIKPTAVPLFSNRIFLTSSLVLLRFKGVPLPSMSAIKLGDAVPMPTFPELLMRKRTVLPSLPSAPIESPPPAGAEMRAT